MTDHKAKSIDLADSSQLVHVPDWERALIVAIAQVHATLHLADVLAQKGADQ